MGRRWSVLALLFATGLCAAPAQAETESPCVRVLDRSMSALVERGLAASPTFRRLYERLAQSDLIVHLERGPHPWLAAGFNQFVAEVADRRFVRITLNVAQLDDDAVALLGHELQHAVELAVAPEVNDLDGYEQLYRRIGYRSCVREPRCFDTVAAVAAGRLVLKELRQARSIPSTSVTRASAPDESDRTEAEGALLDTKTSEQSESITKVNRSALVKRTALR